MRKVGGGREREKEGVWRGRKWNPGRRSLMEGGEGRGGKGSRDWKGGSEDEGEWEYEKERNT